MEWFLRDFFTSFDKKPQKPRRIYPDSRLPVSTAPKSNFEIALENI